MTIMDAGQCDDSCLLKSLSDDWSLAQQDQCLHSSFSVSDSHFTDITAKILPLMRVQAHPEAVVDFPCFIELWITAGIWRGALGESAYSILLQFSTCWVHRTDVNWTCSDTLLPYWVQVFVLLMALHGQLWPFMTVWKDLFHLWDWRNCLWRFWWYAMAEKSSLNKCPSHLFRLWFTGMFFSTWVFLRDSVEKCRRSHLLQTCHTLLPPPLTHSGTLCWPHCFPFMFKIIIIISLA